MTTPGLVLQSMRLARSGAAAMLLAIACCARSPQVVLAAGCCTGPVTVSPPQESRAKPGDGVATMGKGGRARVTAYQDFSFAQSATVSGSVRTTCGQITLSTTKTEPIGGSAFRNVPSVGDAEVTLTFDGTPDEIQVAIEWVQQGEYLKDFSVMPSRLTGTLATWGKQVTTTRPFPADDGAGTLIWDKLGDRQLRFVVGGPPGTALSIHHIMLACER
jgi:hypothetical protein